jgi:predicted DNA-binding transcriptional regulator YafY
MKGMTAMRAPENRLERIEQIERKLAQRPEGWTTGELAREFGVDPSTIFRDLGLLEAMGTGLLTQGRRYILDHRRSLHNVKLSLNELLAIYLAVRLLSRHSDEHNPHVVKALEKLADTLRANSPLIARHIEQAAIAVRARQTRREYVEALEVLTQGWAEGRKVRLRYRSYTKDETTERTFAPYFIEPSGIGYACYVIGYDELREAIRTLKVERVYEARLTEERFTIPESFNPQRLLASAWGVIWRDEGEIEVMLRFAPSVVRRVRESIWHHSQRIEDLPDGSCLFIVKVGSTQEVKPWIRGWGAAVEVLAPPKFREEIITEVREMAQVYGVQ